MEVAALRGRRNAKGLSFFSCRGGEPRNWAQAVIRVACEPGLGPAQGLEVLGNGNPRYFADHMQPGRSVFPRQEDVDSEVGESALSCDRDWP